MTNIELPTTQNVIIRYEIAGVIARIVAFIIDFLLISLLYTALIAIVTVGSIGIDMNFEDMLDKQQLASAIQQFFTSASSIPMIITISTITILFALFLSSWTTYIYILIIDHQIKKDKVVFSEILSESFSSNVLDIFMALQKGAEVAELATEHELSESSIYVYKQRVQKALMKEIYRLDKDLG